jgi:hypothetical protein
MILSPARFEVAIFLLLLPQIQQERNIANGGSAI